MAEYNVIEAYNLQGLVTMVNEAIQAGWFPLGGIATTYCPDVPTWVSVRYSQAMVKNGDEMVGLVSGEALFRELEEVG